MKRKELGLVFGVFGVRMVEEDGGEVFSGLRESKRPFLTGKTIR